MGEILDSGSRREFDSGAVRDIDESKGRCDLLPLDIVARLFNERTACSPILDKILMDINKFIREGDASDLRLAFARFAFFRYKSMYTAMLELSIHFKDGCEKYGERNWEKGIPIHCYLDSAIRHLLKYFRDDEDEPHDRAFLWNIICCLWTLKNKPEMNDLSNDMSVGDKNDDTERCPE